MLTSGDSGAEPHWRDQIIPAKVWSEALFLPRSHLLLKAAWDMGIFTHMLQMNKLELKGIAQSHTGTNGSGSGLSHNPDFKANYSTCGALKMDPREEAQGSRTGELGSKPGITSQLCGFSEPQFPPLWKWSKLSPFFLRTFRISNK